ncbi:sulfite reductase [Halalkalibacter wakoensis JCM 9140]|uniref:assimilatory sulfite reductase (NADPH) n=1 Tax=Halalkalibacter wakoensis JCM 9140 TaxID=1236970 RepID=W4Q7R3_9BACI|nr:sulfite reductase subunit alpha [Halalkalibacter wakoensis]GAE27404.1 sulfite reductase [Halalkalibacter wakoensis JCM 9140]
MEKNSVKNDGEAVSVPYSRTNPYEAKVLKKYNLNKPGSNKETLHVELSLKDSNLEYVPGDCLGIFPENDPKLVSTLLSEMNWNPDEIVPINKKGDTLPLGEALTTYFEITLLTKKIVQQAATLTDNKDIQELILPENKDQLKEYMEGRDLLDLIRDFGPLNGSAEEIVAFLRKMPPRLYSIASSLSAHPDEVHLTIGAVRYEAHGREREGVCSVQCAERVDEGETLPVFLQPNKHFFLPESTETDIIMVGPGTGIAPFRSFIEERAVAGGEGKTWLFFGDRHSATDFLYEDELKKYQEDGVLTKLDVAFSRDTDQKVYVQHKMLEQSKELYEWIKGGAYFYVCGDKQYMAKDVHEALLDIVEKEGGMSREEAEEYVTKMQKEEKRYQRDVY